MQRLILVLGTAGLVIAAGCQVPPPEPDTDAAALPGVPVEKPPALSANEPLKQRTAPAGLDEIVVTAHNNDSRTDELAVAPLAVDPGNSGARNEQSYRAKVMADASLSVASPYPHHPAHHAWEPVDRENYAHLDANPVRVTADDPVSTFSIDVDTASYANVRRMLNEGRLPPADAVRVEELINYFDYDYAAPRDRERPFSVSTEVAATPWNPDTLLLQVGLKAWEVPAGERPDANLVFLVDVSGSMQSPDKLPLLKNALRLLTSRLTARDRVAIAVYAGASGVVLESTPGDRRADITGALARLHAGGSTNGGAGIELAYRLAQQGYIDGGINRVILATDGDFNVGTVNFEALLDMVKTRRDSGIALTALGFGTGNINDHLLEQLADNGNGNYAYIDGLKEARKVLVSQLGATLQTVAGDVKIQVEFNPAAVAEYRLIGYENRVLRREDFNNDKVDAGEIGAGHTVTALYELVPAGSGARLVDPLRYGAAEKPAVRRDARELAFVKLRYKRPGERRSVLVEQPVLRRDVRGTGQASESLRFAAAVAAFGQQLAGNTHLGEFGYAGTLALAESARGADRGGHRGEFLGLVELAAVLDQDRLARR